MPISFKKTWDKACNIPLADTTTHLGNNQQLLHRIVTELVNPALTSPWVAVASSDGVAAGAGNLWVDAGDVIPGPPGVGHSWIVLQQDGVAVGFQVCLEVADHAQARELTIVWSFGGFDVVAPSNTNRPTAPDEVVVFEDHLYGYGTFAAPPDDYNLSVIVSTDGSATRIWNIVGANCCMLLSFDKPLDAPAEWGEPMVVISRADTNGGEVLTFNPMLLSATVTPSFVRIRSQAGEPVQNCALSPEGVDVALGLGVGTTLNLANEASGEWPLGPLTVWCEFAGARGEYGYLADFWIGTETPATGDTYPNDGSRQIIQLGDFAMPWDGSVPPTGGVERDADVLTGVVDEPYDFTPNSILPAIQTTLGNPSLFIPQPRPI